MIVGNSALLAVLCREANVEKFETAILNASRYRMPEMTLPDTSIVVATRGGVNAGHELDGYLAQARIKPVPVTREQCAMARQAWRRFGRGTHPAALGLGDGFACAFARETLEPFLYKGASLARAEIVAPGMPKEGETGG